MLTFAGIFWFSSIMISASVASENSTSSANSSTSTSSSSQNSSLTSDSLEILRKESFKGWKQWAEKYPACNPKNNPNQSPIKIDGNIEKGNDMKGIFIHSKVPVDNCLTLSLLYKKGDFEMEAVTLNALPGCSEQLTYISGGGDKPLSLRYFKRAVFFFTSTQPEGERSFHQLKEKQFQMEVMLEFMTANKKDCTQVFILVEAGSLEATPANPIFTALEPSLEALKQEVMNEASGKTERAVKFKELQTACSTNEEKHMKMHEETKAVYERFETVKTLITNINGITNHDLEKLKSSNSSTIENSNSSKSTNETTEKAETMQGKLEKLQSERSKLLGIMQHETEAWALDKLQTLYTKLERIINKMEYAKNMGKSWNEYKLEKIKKHLKANKVGVPGESSFPEMLYDSPDAVHKDFEDIQGKISEYQEAKELYNKSCQEFADFQMEPYAFVKIDHPFQISWLFPHTGGYYLYDGSNPLPECEQRDTTIVLEGHLSVTAEQLSLFQNLPSLESLQNGVSSSNKEGDASKSSENNVNSNVDKMVPVLSSSDKSRKVWYVNKHPLFLDDDGFHKMTAQIKQSSGTNLVKKEWTRDISFTFSIGCYVMMSTMIYKLH